MAGKRHKRKKLTVVGPHLGGKHHMKKAKMPKHKRSAKRSRHPTALAPHSAAPAPRA